MTLFTNAAKNLMLEALDEASITGADFASLHTAYPGTTGTGEVTGGAPAYARKGIVWAAAAAGSKALTGTAVFDVPTGTSVGWVGFWDAVTVGTFLFATPAGGGALKTFAVDDIATDVFDSPAHGLTAGQAVVVWGTALPTGVVQGTTYYARDILADSFKLAATSGGVAIDITVVGTGHAQLQVIESFGAQGTYTLSAATIAVA
ncbi:MAG TPA: hypothetical protein VNM48_03995 [Chloroflexota bacterium]|nr:hypothetical protein [Chloroflexota bacterium]